MTLETISITSPPDTMTALVGTPSGAGPWSGVIVVHDALGTTTDLARQVEWLAREGYLTAAPDLYWRGGRLRCMFSATRAMSSGRGAAFDDLAATHEWLSGRSDCSGRIGVVGFCMGGGFAWALAGTGDYQAANSNYGSLPDYSPERFADACPIIATYGARDRSLRGASAKLMTALEECGIEHEIAAAGARGRITAFFDTHLRELSDSRD
jgi:carboxymethylenebutenolidase